jgi:hypothetical protein
MGNTCDYPAPLDGFNTNAYAGVWYNQWRKRGLSYGPDDASCMQGIYWDLNEESGEFRVDNWYEPPQDLGNHKGSSGHGYCPNNDGHCWVNLGWFWTWEPNY